MAYQTGSVQNTYELYDAFAAWLTGSSGPGWNLQATTTLNSTGTGSTDVRDKVFWSSGSTGNESLTYRAMFLNPNNMGSSSYHVGITASVVGKSPAHIENVFDYITFKGYLDWQSGSSDVAAGTSSFGTYGHAIMQIPRRSDTVGAPHPPSIYNFSSSAGKFHFAQVNDTKQFNYTKTGNSAQGMDAAIWGWFDNPGRNAGIYTHWDGRRRFFGVSNYTQNTNGDEDWDAYTEYQMSMGCYDLGNGNTQGFKADAADGPYEAGKEDHQFGYSSVLTFDKDTQNEYIFYQANGEAYFWRKINLKTGELSLLANPTKSTPAEWNSAAAGWTFVWDGNDFIYCGANYATSGSYRYSISGDSWVTLSARPVINRWENDNTVMEMVYIPASASLSTLTSSLGTPTDVVYWFQSNYSNDATTLYRYDVSNDNWITDVDLPAAAVRLRDKVWWDGDERLWFQKTPAAVGDTSTIYYRNISSSADYHTWVTHESNFQSPNIPFSGSTNCIREPFRGHPSKIRGQQESFYQSSATKMNYWFQGDQDSINIVTETSGAFYWAHFGTYDSIVSTTTMKATAGFSPGTIVTVPVESTTGFVTGQEVIFADVSGSATVEKNQILEVVNSTSFKVTNLNNSFNSGTLIGTDPHRAIVTGDSFLSIASLDGGGYRSDDMASMYRVVPGIPYPLMMATNTNSQGFYTPWPLLMYGNNPSLSTYQAKGMLKNCWVMQMGDGTYPTLVSGDSLNIAGTSYKVFPLEETTTMMGNSIDRLLLLIKTE